VADCEGVTLPVAGLPETSDAADFRISGIPGR